MHRLSVYACGPKAFVLPIVSFSLLVAGCGGEAVPPLTQGLL